MSTHTYATLDVSADVYAYIREALEMCGYDHAIHVERGGHEVLDMSGIALSTRGTVSADTSKDADLDMAAARQDMFS